MSNIIVHCPVVSCDYSGKIASVAGHVSGKRDAQHDWQRLGYEGANHFKRVQRGERDSSTQTRVLHIADTHIGKKWGGYGSKQWPVNCMEGFTQAVDTVLSVEPDAAFHTGDLFHNDRHGIKEEDVAECLQELTRLEEADIPFYYILGDHEREEGAKVLSQFERLDVVRHLSPEPVRIGEHIALYGTDYRRGEWWEESKWQPASPPDSRKSILALHQSISPLSNHSRAECSVSNILRQTHGNSGFHFDVIALGQLHKKIDRRIDGCRVICGGATERLGGTKDAFTPFVGLFKASSDAVSYHPFTLC